jgi:Calx-beta domain
VSPGRYALTSGGLTFNPGGALVQHVLVSVVDDAVYNEGASPLNTQTMSLQATETVNGYSSTGTGTITDNETQPALINIGSATIREGDGNARALKLAVTLNKPATTAITVRYQTVDGSATAGTDFKAKSGTLTFRAKAVSAVISLSINGDTDTETDEQFTVKLSTPAGGLLGNDVGTVTILNDDGPSATGVEATVSDAVAYEGGGGKRSKMSFTVSLSKRPGTPVTINYTTVADTATAGTDFKVKSGTLTFKTTNVAKVVTISITADNIGEGNEVVRLVLTGISSGATITDSTGIGTIVDDD